MREILFRGKRIDNGKWVEGGYYLDPYPNKVYIVQWNSTGMGFADHIEVYPEIVGQYTGLVDEMGRKIFEGDILHGQFFAVNRQMFVFNDIHVVFHDGAFRFLCGGKGALPPDEVKRISWAIVGNIHESTEKEEPK